MHLAGIPEDGVGLRDPHSAPDTDGTYCRWRPLAAGQGGKKEAIPTPLVSQAQKLDT